MSDVRCNKCGLLLGRVSGEYEIKCRKCGLMNRSGDQDGNMPRAVDPSTEGRYRAVML